MKDFNEEINSGEIALQSLKIKLEKVDLTGTLYTNTGM